MNVFQLIILVLLLIVTWNPSISFKPFSIHFENWILSLGITLLALGLFLFFVGASIDGRRKAYKEIFEKINIIDDIEPEEK